jgi:hypothetical protein
MGGIEYLYLANSGREETILTGFAKLAPGQTREQVRENLGPPDVGMPRYARDSTHAYLGWEYIYNIRRSVNHSDDAYVQIWFAPATTTLTFAKAYRIPGLTSVGAAPP